MLRLLPLLAYRIHIGSCVNYCSQKKGTFLSTRLVKNTLPKVWDIAGNQPNCSNYAETQ